MSKGVYRINRQFDRITRRFPAATRLLTWLRRPETRMVRIPLGIMLVLGGIFSFLPVLGLWMLPVGLLLLALDVPFLQTPVSGTITRTERRWKNWRRSRRKS